jgi:hypothetical protein
MRMAREWHPVAAGDLPGTLVHVSQAEPFTAEEALEKLSADDRAWLEQFLVEYRELPVPACRAPDLPTCWRSSSVAGDSDVGAVHAATSIPRCVRIARSALVITQPRGSRGGVPAG